MFERTSIAPTVKSKTTGPADVVRTQPVSAPAFAAALILIAGASAVALAIGNEWPLVVVLPVAAYVRFSLKVARQWDKVAVLRLGRYRGLKGPGMFWIIPVVDSLSDFVDLRIRVTDVQAESTLTCDAV
ncbi:MAG TPA: hypothetical protein PLZ95_20000, partial [Bryobacteraceae bacterium]|nr:hypothetical protein [Bryobacteraceae bacterium]